MCVEGCKLWEGVQEVSVGQSNRLSQGNHRKDDGGVGTLRLIKEYNQNDDA